MKYRSLFVAVIVTCSTIVGVSFATKVRSDWRSPANLQLPDTSPVANATQPSAGGSSAHGALPSDISDIAEVGDRNHPPNIPSAPGNSALEQVDRFPHQRLKLRDVVRWGSEVYHFREQIRYAVRQRDPAFIDSKGFGGISKTLTFQTRDTEIPSCRSEATNEN